MAGFSVEAGKWKGLEGAEGAGVGKSPGVPRLGFVIAVEGWSLRTDLAYKRWHGRTIRKPPN